MTPLPQGEAHVYFIDASAAIPAHALALYEAWLAPDERARRDRYRFDRNKREYLLTRALVRSTLSRYASVAPARWTFVANEHGRPAVAIAEHAFLRFNLSNTEGLIALIVARDTDVGIDVEDRSRRGETVGIADRFFSPDEVTALRALPEERQRDRFFDYWTLKEAYIKACGKGLAIPLDHFSFSIGGAESITIAFDPRLPDDPGAWQFGQLALTERHTTSFAVRKGAGVAGYAIKVTRTVPLIGDG